MKKVFVCIVLFTVLIIGILIFQRSTDSRRVEKYVQQQGWELVDRSWDPFGPGWFGEKDSRIYQIVYRDQEGLLHRAHVKTSMLSGVYLTHDQIVEDPESQLAATQSQAALKVAEQWLSLVDQGQYDQSWDEAAAFFKSHVTQDKWTESIKPTREPLGALVSRKVLTQQYTTSASGAPDGQYVVIQFQTSFGNKEQAIETVTPMLDEDGVWRVSGYFIK